MERIKKRSRDEETTVSMVCAELHVGQICPRKVHNILCNILTSDTSLSLTSRTIHVTLKVKTGMDGGEGRGVRTS